MVIVQTILVLVVSAILIGLVARRLKIPYPIALVLGGLVLGFIRQLPNLEFDPEYVFFFFLPPLLYHAAVFTSWRDFRANLRAISLLAIGLVAATTAAVAAVAHVLVPAMPWAAAIALGAIVSPPDAIAATAALEGTGIPRRLVTIVEGESLVNDATGLVIYKYAVAAAVTGAMSITGAGMDFIVVGPGGIAVGIVLGLAFLWIHRHLNDPMIEATFSLAIPFAVYIAAEHIGTSGVLAVVTAGLIRGWYAPQMLSSQMRIRSFAVWDMVVFLLNSLVFIMIGSELDDIAADLPDYGVAQLVLYAAGIAAAVILVRFAWVFASAYLPRFVAPRWAAREGHLSWQQLTVLAWSGMRGVVSLAAALALPLATAAGQPFPERELIAFLTFVVIFATLVIQGMTIAPLARLLGVKGDDVFAREEQLARRHTANAALAEIDKRALEGAMSAQVLDGVRAEILSRLEEIAASNDESAGDAVNASTAARRDLLRAAIGAQRRELIRLRRGRVIGDDVLHRIERELDMQEAVLA